MIPETAADLVADHRAYAAALRAHLAPPGQGADRFAGWRGVRHRTTEEQCAADAGLMGELHAGGWNRVGWPAEAGGLGGDVRHRAVLYDELVAAGLAIPLPSLVLEVLGPTLARFAPALAAELLPRALAGLEWWGQGFSEPEAGSDLAGLRCRASRDGDAYVVSGQKLWTSLGATASRFVCLVRTGTVESRHRGLSMIVIDRDSPGVSVRPVAIASGRNELAEIFFDDVRVGADRLVGPEDGGWGVAMYLMQFERSMYPWQVAAAGLGRLRDLVGTVRGSEVPDGLTTRIGEVYADLVTLRARSAQTIRRLAAGEPVGPEAAVDKIATARAETGLHDLARDVLGTDFVLGGSVRHEEWREEWWYSRSATILGGSAEVQRTVLADHVLRLPKEMAS